MLFALSMDLIMLGVFLGAAITIGMTLTISIVVVTTLSAKRVSVSAASKYGSLATYVESSVEILAGLVLTVLGLLFLAAHL
jgi:ABC-type nickel/cobalt efflux system permease component RcnA